MPATHLPLLHDMLADNSKTEFFDVIAPQI